MPTWSWASVFGEIFWSDPIVYPEDDSCISRSTMLLDYKATIANPSSAFSRVIDWSLTLQAVAETIEWDGAEAIPADDLARDSTTPIDNITGSLLFLEGIVAIAEHDAREQALYLVDGHVIPSQSLDEEDVGVSFYTGRLQELLTNFRHITFTSPSFNHSSSSLTCSISDLCNNSVRIRYIFMIVRLVVCVHRLVAT